LLLLQVRPPERPAGTQSTPFGKEVRVPKGAIKEVRSMPGEDPLEKILRCCKNLHAKIIAIALLTRNLHQLPYYRDNPLRMLVPEHFPQVLDECDAPLL
jgi:hypothetical protein